MKTYHGHKVRKQVEIIRGETRVDDDRVDDIVRQSAKQLISLFVVQNSQVLELGPAAIPCPENCGNHHTAA